MKISAVTTFLRYPLLAVYFRYLYDKYWKDEVYELLVCVHGDNKRINHFIADLFENSRITAIPVHEMGIALDYIYPFVRGDVLMTIDSDTFIEKGGIITKYAKMIDRADVIGTVGNSSRPLSLGVQVAEHFGFVRFNTFLSFWNRKVLDEEPFTFQRIKFRKGEIFLNYEIPEDGYLDTMAYMSLKFLQKKRPYKIIEHLEGCRHIGGLSHLPLGEKNQELMKKILTELPKEYYEKLSRAGYVCS